MIAIAELRKTAREHLHLAGILHKSCGYAVEIALKTRLCRTLRWTEFPFTGGEFQNFKSLQTHNLETLLALSGIRARIKVAFNQEWWVVSAWNPEQRYDPVGTQTEAASSGMLAATRKVLKALI